MFKIYSMQSQVPPSHLGTDRHWTLKSRNIILWLSTVAPQHIIDMQNHNNVMNYRLTVVVTNRPLPDQFVRLDSGCMCACQSACLCDYPSVVRPSIRPSGRPTVHLDVCVFVRLDVCLSGCMCASPCECMCLCVWIYVSVRLNVCVLVRLGICVNM